MLISFTLIPYQRGSTSIQESCLRYLGKIRRILYWILLLFQFLLVLYYFWPNFSPYKLNEASICFLDCLMKTYFLLNQDLLIVKPKPVQIAFGTVPCDCFPYIWPKLLPLQVLFSISCHLDNNCLYYLRFPNILW